MAGVKEDMKFSGVREEEAEGRVRRRAAATAAGSSPKEKKRKRRRRKRKKKKRRRKCVSDTDLSCFPGSCSWIRQRSAALISSSFFRISLCRPDTQSWATVGLTFCGSRGVTMRV